MILLSCWLLESYVFEIKKLRENNEDFVLIVTCIYTKNHRLTYSTSFPINNDESWYAFTWFSSWSFCNKINIIYSLFYYIYKILYRHSRDILFNWLFLTFLLFLTFSLLIPLLVFFHFPLFGTYYFFFYLKQLYSHFCNFWLFLWTPYCFLLKTSL